MNTACGNVNPLAASDDDRFSNSAPPALAIVVPCHNEAAGLVNLRAAIERLRSAADRRTRIELLLVDDGSTDETESRMRTWFVEDASVAILRHETRRGIAAAIATGLSHARAETIASLDADCTYDPLELLPMLRLLTDEVDLVVASPYHPQGGVVGVPAWRLGLSRWASRLYRAVMRNKLHTYTSCVRVYRRSSVVGLPLANSGFVGVVELLWQVDRRGGKIVEHPAVLRARTTGQSKMRVAHTTFAHLRFLSCAVWCRLFSARLTPFRGTKQVSRDQISQLCHTLESAP
jgi:dolichol-phosphate mannosyltransferase